MSPEDNLDDVLFQLERKIARRADQLSRDFGIDPRCPLEHWREAEQEVWSDNAAVRDREVAS